MGRSLKISSSLVTIIVFIAGFIFLLRACLSRYDERSALLPALYFEKKESKILLSLAKFDKTTSYSSSGGMTRKSVSTTYYIQTNDVLSGAKIGQKELKDADDIHQYPIEVLAGVNGVAWLFVGELLAYDPFTLEKLADIETIESKNPEVKGKLPTERRFYSYNPGDQHIAITINDGTLWNLDTKNYKISPANPKEDKNALLINSLKERLTSLQEERANVINAFRKSLPKSDRPLIITDPVEIQKYKKQREDVFKQQSRINALGDSLQKVLAAIEATNRREEAIKLRRESLQQLNASFDQIRINEDTLNGHWYGLFSQSEWKKQTNNYIDRQSLSDEVARRALYSGGYRYPVTFDSPVERLNEDAFPAGTEFLQGGFLVDKNTTQAIHLENPLGFLVVHKDKIGDDGRILLSRVTLTGKELWRFEMGLKGIIDWQIRADRLLVFGNDNEELSSSDCNLLYTINLATGKAIAYDYFADKVR